MIVDCISDLHGYLPTLEGGDLLIIAGDLTATHKEREYQFFCIWLNNQSYRKKLLISGNHDTFLQGWDNIKYGHPINDPDKFTEYLCDSGTEFEGLKIWGSPWTSQFPGINPRCCAFTRPLCVPLKDRWDLIPDDVDILITHGPPFGILDRVERDCGLSAGDTDLRDALEKRIKPQLHVFGHIHENGGQKIVFKRPGFGAENNTICVNASYVNERYQPVHKPVRVVL